MKKLTMISALIIEDDKNVLGVLGKYLEKRLKHVYLVSDAESGLEIVSKDKPDIIITDLELPGMNGLDMIAELRNRRKYDKPIIVVTGHEEGRYYSSLANEYLYKPIDLEKLIESISRLLSAE